MITNRLLPFIAANIIFGTLQLGANPVCSVKQVTDNCEKLKTSGAVFKKYEDGTFLPNYVNIETSEIPVDDPLYLKSVAPLISDNPINQQRVSTIYTKLISLLKKYLTEHADANSDLKSIFTRLDKLKLKFVSNYSLPCSSKVRLGEVNAAYDPERHGVLICPSMANLPTLAQLRILSHELGHVISPCHYRYPLLEVSKASAAAIRKKIDECNYIPEDLKKPAYQVANTSFLANIPMSSNFDFENLTKCGVLKPFKSGTPIKNHPLKEIFNCVSQHYSADIKSIHLNSIKNQDKLIEQFSHSSDSVTKKQLTEIRKLLVNESTEDLLCGSQLVEEHQADLIGSELSGRYLSNKGFLRTKDAATQFFYQDIMGACKDQILKQEPQVNGGHPIDLVRFNTYAQNLNIQKFLDCHFDGAEFCSTSTGAPAILEKNEGAR